MIIIEIIKVKWEPGKETVGFTSIAAKRRFESWIANEFIRLIRLSVKQQRFKAMWPPLSQAYSLYKRENKLSPLIWEATGELIDSLKFKKTTSSIGFDNKRRHKVSKEPLLLIARRVEYGDLGVPPRPLFRQVYWYMRKNISFFVDRYRRGL